MTVCLLSIIRKQYLKQYNYNVGQSVLLITFRTDVPSDETYLCDEERAMAVFADYRECRKHIKRERANEENGSVSMSPRLLPL